MTSSLAIITEYASRAPTPVRGSRRTSSKSLASLRFRYATSRSQIVLLQAHHRRWGNVMIGSLIVGSLVVTLGACCVIVGLVVAITARHAGVGAFSIGQVTSALKAFTESIKALASLPAASQLLVLGMVLIAGGIWLLDARPF